MTANKPMTSEQLDELMTVAVNMQRDSEKAGERPSAMFAYAVQVAVLELRKVRNDSVELEQKLADSQREFRAADATIENLQMQVEKLAAENAGLKQFPDQIVGFIVKLGSSEIGSETKEKIEAAAKKIKTPATDAFLAEVRAQGAEMFAAYCGEENSVFVEAKAYYRSLPDAAYEFAAQLRKGVQS